MASILGITMRGPSGQLKSGSRVIAIFDQWVLTDLPGVRRAKLVASYYTPHPVDWARRFTSLKVTLDLGNQIGTGTAEVVREDPLELVIEEIDIEYRRTV